MEERTAELAKENERLKKAADAMRRLNEDLERRVAERTAQLEAADKEMEAFIYSVSHDLRAPLRIIEGFTRIVLEDYAGRLDEEGKRLLKAIRGNTQRMDELIKALLSLSHAGRQQMNIAELDMEELARTVFDELKSASQVKDITVEIRALPSARGDAVLIKQVFTNLISNALKFTRIRDRAFVEIGFERKDGEDIYFVRDNGAGFNPQFADKLFGVFRRLHSFKEFEGTGIGLSIVERIIRRHGGRVWAEGKVNEGATFYFTLPPIK